jgi:hypothetical protein
MGYSGKWPGCRVVIISLPAPEASSDGICPGLWGRKDFPWESTEQVPDLPAGSLSGAAEPSWFEDKEKKIRHGSRINPTPPPGAVPQERILKSGCHKVYSFIKSRILASILLLFKYLNSSNQMMLAIPAPAATARAIAGTGLNRKRSWRAGT